MLNSLAECPSLQPTRTSSRLSKKTVAPGLLPGTDANLIQNRKLSNGTCTVFGQPSPLLDVLPAVAVFLNEVQHKKWDRPCKQFEEVDYKKKSNSKSLHRAIVFGHLRCFAPSRWDTLLYSTASGFDSVPMNNVILVPGSNMCSTADKKVIAAGKDDFLKEWCSRFLVRKNEKKQKEQNKQKKKGEEDEGEDDGDDKGDNAALAEKLRQLEAMLADERARRVAAEKLLQLPPPPIHKTFKSVGIGSVGVGDGDESLKKKKKVPIAMTLIYCIWFCFRKYTYFIGR